MIIVDSDNPSHTLSCFISFFDVDPRLQEYWTARFTGKIIPEIDLKRMPRDQMKSHGLDGKRGAAKKGPGQ